MADSKPQTYSGYSPKQTGLAERTLVTTWRYIGEYRDHLVLVGGLVPRYLVDEVPEKEVAVGQGHCGTMDVDFGVSLAVADLETYASIKKRLTEKIGFQQGENDAGNKQMHSFVLDVDGVNINIDFLTTKYGGSERTIRAVEKGLSAIQVEGLGLAIKDPKVVNIRADLLTGDGMHTAEIPVCRVVPYVVLKSLSFTDRGERKDAYDLVYTLLNYKDGAASVAAEIREDERASNSFCHALKEMERNFSSEVENGPVAYSNFVEGNKETAAASAFAVVKEFLSYVEER